MNSPLPSKTSALSGQTVILGAGPAGLACAYELSRHQISATVIDRNPCVGGLLRTVSLDGYIFDIGGHRFLSKNAEVNALWQKILGPDLIRVKRKSRILYRDHYFEYPLKAWDALKKLGLFEILHCLASYLHSKIFPAPADTHFEAWMIRKFGKRLYEIFFKTYTEKVWGIPCSDLSSDWADQRIQGLSLGKAVHKAFSPNSRNQFKTLAEEFIYPLRGPGQFCEKLKDQTEKTGCTYRLETTIEEIGHQNSLLTHAGLRNAQGRSEILNGEHFFSSLPLPVFIKKLHPAAPENILAAAQSLTFRSFMAVYLVFDIPQLFPDQWLYIHAPEIKAGRIQNYKNWSAAMVPDQSTTSLGMEYFVNENDETWQLTDAQMTQLALCELEKTGFKIKNKFRKSLVVRVPNAYPLYSLGYKKNVALLRAYLKGFTNLQSLGRAGLFRYNNSDHALLTGLYGARNMLGAHHDLWVIDPDAA